MNPDTILDLARHTFFTAALILAPMLAAGVLVGLAIAMFQAMTSLHEQTMTIVPKMAAVVAVLLLTMPWLVRLLVDYTRSILGDLSRFRG